MKPLNNIHILVVEDEPDLLEIIIDSLTNRGALVLGVENGRLAFALLKERPFDVVLSDVRMPGGDGVELLKNINSELPLKPKLFLYSGFSDLTDVEVEALGVSKFFSKPTDMKELVQAIADSMRKND